MMKKALAILMCLACNATAESNAPLLPDRPNNIARKAKSGIDWLNQCFEH